MIDIDTVARREEGGGAGKVAAGGGRRADGLKIISLYLGGILIFGGTTAFPVPSRNSDMDWPYLSRSGSS